MKPIDRIEQLIKHLGGNVSAFEKSIGASNNSIGTAIRRKSNVKDDTLKNILDAYPEISAEWLLMGVGNMIAGTESDFLNNIEKSEKAVDKFKDITPEDIANYLVTNFEELRNNPLIDLFIEKEVWKRQVEKGDTNQQRNYDKYDKIAKLKKLLDDGALTQDEYEREKAKLLGSY